MQLKSILWTFYAIHPGNVSGLFHSSQGPPGAYNTLHTNNYTAQSIEDDEVNNTKCYWNTKLHRHFTTWQVFLAIDILRPIQQYKGHKIQTATAS